ncbi:MAG: hypothetical protein PVG78_01075 [Desulfobacterales bacterium]|jgi:phosphoribosylaminoimidazolecarboxamide formyltransferase/IMP cyclohydrolase
MSINVVERIDDQVAVRHALVSVSDKTGLDTFIPGLLAATPGLKIFSTGGTFAKIGEILKEKAEGRLVQVSDYTGQPETQGGLVKTLDFKIYLGLLTETYNEAHRQDLSRTAAVPIDLVVVNLYPFEQTVARQGVTVEEARGNIDIGGPCMIRASAKNFLRVAPVVDPGDYGRVLAELSANDGRLGVALRFELAKKAFAHTAAYDRAIADFLADRSEQEMKGCYTLEK